MSRNTVQLVALLCSDEGVAAASCYSILLSDHPYALSVGTHSIVRSDDTRCNTREGELMVLYCTLRRAFQLSAYMKNNKNQIEKKFVFW